jgi:dTMP kinase
MGLLINFEATDRVGKSTSHRLVAERLRAAGKTVAGMGFPDRPSNAAEPSAAHFSTGILIDRYLRGAMPLADEHDPIFDLRSEDGEPLLSVGTADRERVVQHINERLAQVLFSINRRERMHGGNGLYDLMAANDVVIVERALSARTYGVAMGVSQTQLDAVEGDLPLPDLTVLIDLDPAVARARRSADAIDKYEADLGFQERVRALYGELIAADAVAAESEGRLPRFLRLDGTMSPEAIAEAVTIEILRRAEAA